MCQSLTAVSELVLKDDTNTKFLFGSYGLAPDFFFIFHFHCSSESGAFMKTYFDAVWSACACVTHMLYPVNSDNNPKNLG